MNKKIIFDDLRNLVIGTVDYVSSDEIKILLEINTPQNTVINAGEPSSFPKINGFVLIPNEEGALVGIISWIGVEYSPYPKRKGLKDFDLIDLPYPRRKLSINPVGILKNIGNDYELERGVYSYPSVGDVVILPTSKQLKAIVENREKNAKIQIGTSPIAGNAPIYVDPDKLFGRHIAVLGNTGSGKSCSVAGLIRWSIEGAQKEKKVEKNVNARFIILDPNGEYSKAFNDMKNRVRKFKVVIDKEESDFIQLMVPVWMWNSYEWGSITQASGRTQWPLLKRALREVRYGSIEKGDEVTYNIRRYYSSWLIEIKNDLSIGVSRFKGDSRNKFGKKIMSIVDELRKDSNKVSESLLKEKLQSLSNELEQIVQNRCKSFINEEGKKIKYYEDFKKADVEEIIMKLDSFLNDLGGIVIYKGPNEDSPIFFKDEVLLNHLERLSQEKNQQQYMDWFLMRVRTMLSDQRMSSIIRTEGTEGENYLVEWLENYIGKNKAENGEISIIDLSLVPSDIIHIVIAVIARIVFEALQRYRNLNGRVLPTVLVLEEAHTFIRRHNDSDELSPSKLCTQIFEKIAREGRKFGLGLVISSQRPSELSPTVLSQCNTFLLHRLVNDKDQELVKKLVPDNLGALLNELPVLPTRKAILLGWASPIPILVEINELEEEYRPQSADPDFWNVWVGKNLDGKPVERDVDWKSIVKDWQEKS